MRVGASVGVPDSVGVADGVLARAVSVLSPGVRVGDSVLVGVSVESNVGVGDVGVTVGVDVECCVVFQ